MAKKRALQGTKAQHKNVAALLMDRTHSKMEAALKAVDEGRCTVAYMNIVEMWEARGESNANGRWAGGTAPFNTTDAQELGYKFTTRCLRDTPTIMGASRRRKRR